MIKILITAPGFSKSDPAPMELLARQGYHIDFNDTGSPLGQEEFAARIKSADGVILGTESLTAEILESAKRLKVVSRYGVGTDNIDLEYAARIGVTVCRTVGANAAAVADSAFALMLCVAKGVTELDRQVRRGDWREPVTYEMNGKTLGLIGLGNIGSLVARRASGFDMHVLAFDICKDEKAAKACGAEYVDTLETLLSQADFISIHVPLLPETRHLISDRELALMKPKAVLVNTARGGIVDEEALCAALKEGRLLGAGLDVFEIEPLPPNSPLLEAENLVLSPHSSADTFESAHKVSLAAAQNLINGINKHLSGGK